MKKIDLAGQRFGKLIAISFLVKDKESYWLCKCDCGKEKYVRSKCLRHGYTKSCGCIWRIRKFKDLTGKKFGRLIAIKPMGKDLSRSKGGIFWLCRCECGKETIINSYNMHEGGTKSCGCQHIVNWNKRLKYPTLGPGFNKILKVYTRRAKIRNLSWDLSIEQFTKLLLDNCFYCGIEPQQRSDGGFMEDYVYNGIDRIDNNYGYSIDNSVTCCGKCNRMKLDMSLSEFYKRIETIYLRKIKNEEN